MYEKISYRVTSIIIILAACGQDSDQQKDSNKEKDDKAKTEQQDKKQMIHLKIRKTIKMIVKT